MLAFERKKRTEEKTKKSRKAKDKLYEDYPWTELCEYVTKPKKATNSRTKQVLKPLRAEAAFEQQEE